MKGPVALINFLVLGCSALSSNGQCVRNVTAIAAAGDHSLALKSDGTVVAWGSDDYGQSTLPSSVGNVTAIAAGFYTSIALVLPRPSLTLNSQPSSLNQLILSWPTNYSGFTLQSSASLNPPTWADFPIPPMISGGQFFVTNPISSGSQFFRLRK